MSRTFHVRAWVAWLAWAAVFTLAVDNPIASIASLLALAAVAIAFRSAGPEGNAAALFFKLGLVFIAVRVVLFGLTGHPGSTTLFTLPSLGLPSWLGGFSVGGRVTGEVVAQQVAEGLKIAAFLACFGVFLASVETYRVLRLLPRFLFEAGLVVGIALAFVPSMLRTASDVRDAQRLRGHRFRGLRSIKPLVLPVISGALERSLALAASMESRGFGRSTDARERETIPYALVLLGIVGLCCGGGLAIAGRGPFGAACAIAGVTATGIGFRLLSKTVARTRLRVERVDRWDVALIAAAVAGIVVTVATRRLGAAHWYAFPTLHAPVADVRLIALGSALALPAVLVPLRAASFRRADARHPLETTA